MGNVLNGKQTLRSRRLLGLLVEKTAHIEQTTNPELLLMHICGERHVKCPRIIIASWVSAGFVQLTVSKGRQKIAVTDDGVSFVTRGSTDGFADQHLAPENRVLNYEGESVSVMVARNESPLSKLAKPTKGRAKSWLERMEYDAGERLRSDFEYANLGPKVTASWDPTATLSGSKGGRRPSETMSERAMAARNRLNKALEAVGPEMAGILVDVCCYLKGLEQVEFERQWPRRSAKLLLKTALAVLARHYFPANKTNKQSVRHWGSENYRPEM